MIICPVCEVKFDDSCFSSLSSHFIENANKSDTALVMILNWNILNNSKQDEPALNL